LTLRHAFGHRLQAAELEAGERDPPFPAHRIEAEVGEEVRGEDRPVDEEALVRALSFRIAVAEGLDRLRALLLRIADGGEEEALHHPRRRQVDEVCARDEHGVRGRRARGKLERAREMS
jgi:hypothetical protein